MGSSFWLTWASFVTLVVAVIVTIIGLATPYWATSDFGTDYNEGLWERCGTVCVNTVDQDNPGWFEGVQALMIMGFFGQIVGIFILLCWACTYRLSMLLKVITMLTIFVSFLILAAAVIVYKLEYDSSNLDLDWSFYLSVVGCVLTAISVGLLAPVDPSRRGRARYPGGYPMFQKFGGFGFGPKFARPQNYTYGGIYGTGYGYGGGYGGYGSPVYGVQPGAARYYYNRPSPAGMVSSYNPYSYMG